MISMKTSFPLHGLVAATHTPFHPDGSLNLAAVEKQAALMLRQKIRAVFIGGTTGESSSLTLEERLALAQRWSEVVRGTELGLVVHVGSNCLADACTLAAQARRLGATALSALAPSYFKPKSLDVLIAGCAQIAAAAPETPFYYYDIPSFTGVSFPMVEFLEKAAARVLTLAGLKFTNPDLMMYLQCVQAGDWDLPWGLDEWLLSAVAAGARGAVGSSYNFAAAIYHEILTSVAHGDLAAARVAQGRSARLIGLLARYGYMGAAKATMRMLGVDVGGPRLPNTGLTGEQVTALRGELEEMGFFEWVRP